MKNTNFKLFLLLFFLSLIPVRVIAAELPTYNSIVFFGDSLSDNGNLYAKDLGYVPKSPPYYQGRFSNGPVWSEQVATYFADNNKVTAYNYAVGGSTVNFHNPASGFLPYDLSDAVDDYYYRNFFYDKTHTLFVILMGANDYINGDSLDPDKDSTAVIATLQAKVEYLISIGGQSFLMINLPDLSQSPWVTDPNQKQLLQQVTNLHNSKLATAVADIQSKHPDVLIHLADAHSLFDELWNSPVNFNLKYHTRITDITDACWPGTYDLRRKNQAAEITNQFAKNYALSPYLKNGAKQAVPDFHGFALSVANNVDLGAAFAVDKASANGVVACADPDAYAFWDSVHPTAVLHTVMAGLMIDTIKQNFHTE
jgi:phospholipase/lecithinase/hemolysin